MLLKSRLYSLPPLSNHPRPRAKARNPKNQTWLWLSGICSTALASSFLVVSGLANSSGELNLWSLASVATALGSICTGYIFIQDLRLVRDTDRIADVAEFVDLRRLKT